MTLLTTWTSYDTDGQLFRARMCYFVLRFALYTYSCN